MELAALCANCQKRPTFHLDKKANKEWFERFQEEFEVMWDRAQEIDLSTDKSASAHRGRERNKWKWIRLAYFGKN